MNRSAFSILGGLGGGLLLAFGSIVVLEASHRQPALSSQQSAMSQPTMAAAADIHPDRTATWVAVSLARPLFSHRRRPPAAVTPAIAGPQALPRLTGILISPGQRLAIFAPGHGKPIITGQGGRIGAFTVRRIAADHVTVLGADGVHVLHTVFGGAIATAAPIAHAKPPPLFAGLAALAKTSHSIVFDQGKPDLPSAATWSGPPGLSALPQVQKPAASAPLLHPAPNGSGH